MDPFSALFFSLFTIIPHDKTETILNGCHFSGQSTLQESLTRGRSEDCLMCDGFKHCYVYLETGLRGTSFIKSQSGPSGHRFTHTHSLLHHSSSHRIGNKAEIPLQTSWILVCGLRSSFTATAHSIKG